MIASLFGSVWFPLALLVAFILIQVLIFRLRPKIKPFWATLQDGVADALHRPGAEYAEIDLLYEKLEKLTLTPKEKIRLLELLDQFANEPNRTSASFKAKIAVLRIAIPKVIDEATGTISPPIDMRTIREKKIRMKARSVLSKLRIIKAEAENAR